MTSEELKFLLKEETKNIIACNITKDVTSLALKGVNPAVCTQIKYLQKCTEKLPSYYKKQCIIPPLSYEQSSSEVVASCKRYKGKICIDLTTGLGVDTLNFSKNFESVISVEMNDVLCSIAKHNIGLLGADNVTFINDDSVNFIKNYSGEKVDMIYVDPARRDVKNKKVALFEDCSPNIIDLMPVLSDKSYRVVIKASPMFDVDECFNIFSKYGSINVSAVSLCGECKEVLIDVFFGKDANNSISNIVINSDNNIKCYSYKKRDKYIRSNFKVIDSFKYIAIADVSFYKTRTLINLIMESYADCDIFNEHSVVLSDYCIDGFPGKRYRITDVLEYKPKLLKKYFKDRGINKITIIKHNFSINVDAIRTSLNLKDGNDAIVLCSEIHNINYMFIVEPL